MTVTPIAAVSFAVAALACSCPAFGADSVYKCVVNGKIRYSAAPPATDGQCQETAIRDDGPTPEEWARLQEEKQRRQEEERKAQEAALKEREIRAKEIEAAAAVRRARAEEQQLLLQRQQQYEPAQPPLYVYPYWGGGFGRPLPPAHPHPAHPHLRPQPAPPPQQAAPPSGFRPR